MQQHTQSKAKIITTVTAIIVVAGVILVADYLKSHTTTTAVSIVQSPVAATTQSTATTSSTTPASTSTTASTASATYTDGTYTATSHYYVPHGSEDIAVTLTIKNGVITNTAITNSESDRDSQQYQEQFASEYKQYVVGKSIAGLKLSTISGASDTTQGFNDALSQIATKAQA